MRNLKRRMLPNRVLDREFNERTVHEDTDAVDGRRPVKRPILSLDTIAAAHVGSACLNTKDLS